MIKVITKDAERGDEVYFRYILLDERYECAGKLVEVYEIPEGLVYKVQAHSWPEELEDEFTEQDCIIYLTDEDMLSPEKCISCEERIDRNEEEKYGNYYSDEGEPLCYGCYESDLEYASTIVVYSPDGKVAYRIGSYVSMDTECGENVPDEIFKMFEKPKWHSTDPWRGYYEITHKDGMKRIVSGWITGCPDETVAHKQKAIDLGEMLEKALEDKEALPFTMYWIFCPTSNVFSTASDIFIHEKDIPEFEEWLSKKLNYTIDDIERAFA